MSGWTKYFSDGTKIIGNDRDVREGKISWINSKNDNIIKVELFSHRKIISITGLGEYWQSDGYETSILNKKPQLVYRRIMKRIEPWDKGYRPILDYNETLHITFFTEKCLEVDKKLVGLWVVAEIDIKNNRLRHYVRGNKI